MAKLNINTYEEWLQLDKSQQELLASDWNTYQKEGYGFALCAAGRLILASDCKVIDAIPGLYHGGEWVLHATVHKNDLPSRPKMLEQEFEGFRVIWIAAKEAKPPPGM